jgi:hypothetical protein
MNNLYHKVAVASVCTALGFVLGASPEAKAASFTFAPTITFEVIDGGIFGDSFDGLGDQVFPGNFDTVVKGRLVKQQSLPNSISAAFLLPLIQLLAVLFFRLRF